MSGKASDHNTHLLGLRHFKTETNAKKKLVINKFSILK